MFEDRLYRFIQRIGKHFQCWPFALGLRLIVHGQVLVPVTGASSGFGWAIAELLIERGYVVFGTSRSKAASEFGRASRRRRRQDNRSLRPRRRASLAFVSWNLAYDLCFSTTVHTMDT
jgi:hypothetical protein